MSTGHAIMLAQTQLAELEMALVQSAALPGKKARASLVARWSWQTVFGTPTECATCTRATSGDA